MHKIYIFPKLTLILYTEMYIAFKIFIIISKSTSFIWFIDKHSVHAVRSAIIKTQPFGEKERKFYCRLYLMRNSCRDRVYNRIQAKNENAEVGLIAHEKFTAKNKTKMKTQNVIFNIIKKILKEACIIMLGIYLVVYMNLALEKYNQSKLFA